MRVIIADDHEAVRRSLSGIITSRRGCVMIGEAAAGDEAVRLAILHRPDVALLDVRMPVLNGIAAASRIVERSPATAVLMVSLSHEAQYVAGALAAGAHGYVGKDEAAEHIPPALEAMERGDYYLSPSAAASVREFASSARYGEIVRDALALFDNYAVPLLQCATVAGAEEHAAAALHQTFLAYLLARAGAQHIPNVAVWLFASVAAFVFEGCPASFHANDKRDRGAGRSKRLRSWWRARLQPHPAISTFVAYWAHEMGESSRRRLENHIGRCPLCHFEWRLAACASERPASGEKGAMIATNDIRGRVEEDLRKCDLGILAASVREHNRRLNALLASELHMFFGANAATEWSTASGPRRLFASPLIAEFLGAKTSSVAATVRGAPSPAW